MGIQAVKDLMVGALMGIVSFLPGASGSTIAVIFKIYERLVADVADIKTGFELLWESEGKTVTHRAWRKL